MPRLLKSKGNIIFKTPVIDEFQRYLCYELYNAQQWNPETQSGGMSSQGWQFSFRSKVDRKYDWKILWSRQGGYIEVVSSQPTVSIRKGLSFKMGKGELVLEGNIPSHE